MKSLWIFFLLGVLSQCFFGSCIPVESLNIQNFIRHKIEIVRKESGTESVEEIITLQTSARLHEFLKTKFELLDKWIPQRNERLKEYTSFFLGVKGNYAIRCSDSETNVEYFTIDFAEENVESSEEDEKASFYSFLLTFFLKLIGIIFPQLSIIISLILFLLSFYKLAKDYLKTGKLGTWRPFCLILSAFGIIWGIFK